MVMCGSVVLVSFFGSATTGVCANAIASKTTKQNGLSVGTLERLVLSMGLPLVAKAGGPYYPSRVAVEELELGYHNMEIWVLLYIGGPKLTPICYDPQYRNSQKGFLFFCNPPCGQFENIVSLSSSR